MSILLRTKLHRPLPAPSLVPRQRLLERLLDRPESTLVLVVASAGSGKTTLLVQWLETFSWPVAWLSLDETDDDLIVFLNYVTAAIQGAFPGTCHLIQKLIGAPQPPPVDYLAATLVNELSDITQPYVLVLEDYHCIRAAAIHQLVSQLLRHAPPSLHLVVSSRFDPPLALSRLASQGKLVEIRAADLRFRSVEAQALLALATGVPLPQGRIDVLVEEMDGWAAGLRSLALALRSPDTRVGLADEGLARDHRRLAGIMADEVLAMQPAGVRDFLLRTALLSQLTAPLCQALFTGDTSGEAAPPDSRAILNRLESENLFIETLDEDHQWYRYHNLFRSVLMRKLEQLYSQAEIATLHRRASMWYWEQGSANEAIQHALAARDTALAAEIVDASFYAILQREEWLTLERWLNMLPGEVVQQHPHLLVAQAWVLYFHFRTQQLPPLLARARSALDERTRPAAAVALVRRDLETLSTLLYFAAGEYARAIEAALQALASIEPQDAFSRGFALFFENMSQFALRGLDAAIELCTRVIDDPLEDVTVRARTMLSLCHMYGIACRPLDQERAARALLSLAQEHDLDVSAAWAHRHLGSAFFERYELDAAVHHFSLVVEQRYLAHFVCARDSYIGLALAYLAQDRTAEAEAAAAALQAFCIERGLANLPEFDSFQARFAFLQGNIDQALQTLARSQQSRTALSMIAYETATLTRVMVHLIAGSSAQRRAAMADLDELQRLAEDSHSTWHLIRILALRAIALHREGQIEEALTILQQAILRGYPGRVVAVIVEGGLPVRQLLQRLVGRGVEPAGYVRELLAACPSEKAADPLITPASGATVSPFDGGLIEPLSAREMEVLALLSQRLPNKEIAVRLVISPLTVKRHMTNIMQKLGVDSRWDAVERAREIGLIPPVQKNHP